MHILQLYKLPALPEGGTKLAVARADSESLLLNLVLANLVKPYLSSISIELLNEDAKAQLPDLVTSVEILRYFNADSVLADYQMLWYASEGYPKDMIVKVPDEDEFVEQVIAELKFKIKEERHNLEQNTVLITQPTIRR